MRLDAFRTLMLASMVSLTACSDAAAPDYTRPAVPQSPPSSPPASPDAIYLAQERSALVGDSALLRAYVYRGGKQGPDTLSWVVQSPAIASIEVVERDRIRVHALRPGQTMVTVRTMGSRAPLSAAVRVNVLARSSEPSPIVADEFRVVQLVNFFDGGWGYSRSSPCATRRVEARVRSLRSRWSFRGSGLCNAGPTEWLGPRRGRPSRRSGAWMVRMSTRIAASMPARRPWRR